MKRTLCYSLFFLLIFVRSFGQNTNNQTFFSLPKIATTPAGCAANEKG